MLIKIVNKSAIGNLQSALAREALLTVLDLIGSRTDVYSIRDDLTVHDAARYLRERQVRSVGVLDANGRLAGVVSQSDISDRVAAENKCPAWFGFVLSWFRGSSRFVDWGVVAELPRKVRRLIWSVLCLLSRCDGCSSRRARACVS